jgi:hypothetical protein
MVIIDKEKIVKIPSRLFGRLNDGIQLEFRSIGKGGGNLRL